MNEVIDEPLTSTVRPGKLLIQTNILLKHLILPSVASAQNKFAILTLRVSSLAQLSVLTVRVIKSFPYRTVKYHVFQNVDITTVTAGEFLEKIQALVKTGSAFRAYRTVSLDTIKIYTKAHGSKSMNLVINFDDDAALILSDLNKTLQEYDIQNETELSVFNREAYEEFKRNPEEKW
ncbi:hypothetical protein NADFUDRAFT_82542 [Nadsonia fulvescens var. elongata DSM 6958]|uniref:Uncharacterized protein n=1 Tax=Nadsonia fulvescens var. elongata DSM 6958 TaxID=857566 RepID=A0A1E3PN27_9ASCO|nr:hypothetical protein NADFUDRAFT_82542 [Nadsonia fulvescens var. elongata DSM 6958]